MKSDEIDWKLVWDVLLKQTVQEIREGTLYAAAGNIHYPNSDFTVSISAEYLAVLMMDELRNRAGGFGLGALYVPEQKAKIVGDLPIEYEVVKKKKGQNSFITAEPDIPLYSMVEFNEGLEDEPGS